VGLGAGLAVREALAPLFAVRLPFDWAVAFMCCPLSAAVRVPGHLRPRPSSQGSVPHERLQWWRPTRQTCTHMPTPTPDGCPWRRPVPDPVEKILQSATFCHPRPGFRARHAAGPADAAVGRPRFRVFQAPD
jgi:hypothetical protein